MNSGKWLQEWVRDKQLFDETAESYAYRKAHDIDSQLYASLSPEARQKLLQFFGGKESDLFDWKRRQMEEGRDGSMKAAITLALGEHHLPEQVRSKRARSPEYYEALEEFQKVQAARDTAQRQLQDRIEAKKMLREIYGQDYIPPGAKEVKMLSPEEVAQLQASRSQGGQETSTQAQRQAQREEFNRVFDAATKAQNPKDTQTTQQQQVIKTPEIIEKMTRAHSD